MKKALTCGTFISLLDGSLKSQMVSFAIPVAAVLPWSDSFLQEYKSGFLKAAFPRTNRRLYVEGKVFSVMTSGFLVWIFAISTILLVNFVIFYPMEAKGSFPKEQFLELLMKALRMGLVGSILSTFGGICGTLWNSAYMAYGIPFVSYYFGIILHERYFKDQIWFYPVEWILADGNWGTDKAGLWLFLLLFLLVLMGIFGGVLSEFQNTCVKIEHVTKRFGEDLVLKEVNLTLKVGQVYGVVGNNGSGKTVLMKCICGFLPVTTGTIRVFGKEIGRDVDFPESLGVIIETPGFLTQYTGVKNLEILADMKRMISKADIRLILKKVGLDPDMKKPVGKYSLGMRQRLGIAQAIMEDPRFLILDEPFNGLDKHGVAEIRELLLDLKAAGKTILLASHNDEDIRILCDHVYEMDGGVLRERTA